MITPETIYTLDVVALCCYALAFVAHARTFLQARGGPTRSTLATLWAAFILHSVSLLLKGWLQGQAPVIGMFAAMSFIAWSVALCFIFLQMHLRSSSLGVFVLPFAVAFAALSLLQSPSAVTPDAVIERVQNSNLLFSIHMASALFSYSCFAIAFAGGVMYLLLDYELHERRLGFFFRRMPPLETIDNINTHAMGLGLSLLAVGIFSGAIALSAAEGESWGDNAKIWTALLIWLVYGVNLLMSIRGGWRGRRSAVVSVASFCLVFALYFIVNLAFTQLHGTL